MIGAFYGDMSGKPGREWVRHRLGTCPTDLGKRGREWVRHRAFGPARVVLLWWGRQRGEAPIAPRAARKVVCSARGVVCSAGRCLWSGVLGAAAPAGWCARRGVACGMDGCLGC